MIVQDIEDGIPELVHDGLCPHRADVLQLTQKFQHILLGLGSHRHRQVEVELFSVLRMLLPAPVEFQLVADDRVGKRAHHLVSAGVNAGDEVAVVELAEDAV